MDCKQNFIYPEQESALLSGIESHLQGLAIPKKGEIHEVNNTSRESDGAKSAA